MEQADLRQRHGSKAPQATFGGSAHCGVDPHARVVRGRGGLTSSPSRYKLLAAYSSTRSDTCGQPVTRVMRQPVGRRPADLRCLADPRRSRLPRCRPQVPGLSLSAAPSLLRRGFTLRYNCCW